MKKIFSFLIVAAFLAACGGGQQGEQPGKRKGVKLAAKGGVSYGGIFRINEVSDFRNLYPLSVTEVTSHRIANQIYQGLLKLNQKDLKVEPCLAERWDVNENATKFTFFLRKGVYFHDDPCFSGGKGREVNAHDFKYCLDKVCEASSDNVMFWLFKSRVTGADSYNAATLKGQKPEGGVAGIKVIDDFTIEITLDYPFAGFDKILSHSGCWVYPKEAYEKYGSDMRTKCVGTGPFKIKLIEDGRVVLLEKNRKYWEQDQWGQQLPYLEGVKFTFTKEKKTELLEFRKGNLDMVWKLPIEEINTILGDLEDAKNGGNLDFIFQTVPGLTIQYYGFQHKSNIFKDVRVRKAFNHAIDRNELVDFTLQGEGEPAIYGIVPPSAPDYHADKVKGYDFDPDKARRLMAEAGYTNGKGFPKLTLQLNSGGKTNEIAAEAVQNMLKKHLGVDVTLEVMPFPQHLERLETGKANFWRTAWVADYPDPENFLNLLYGKHIPEKLSDQSYINSVRYNNPAFDSAFSNALQEVDLEKRMDLFARADQIAMDDAAIMPLYYDSYIRLLQLDVANFDINAMEYRDLTRVYFKVEQEEEDPE